MTTAFVPKMILGVGGELESGKSTVAGIIVQRYGFTEKSFARNLKAMVIDTFGLTDYDVNDTQGKKTPFTDPMVFSMYHIEKIVAWATDRNGFYVSSHAMQLMKTYIGRVLRTPREILQFVGTEICRDCIHDRYHIKVVEDEITAERLEWVVVSDARFANERLWVESKLGFTILAYNPHAPAPAANAHQSEQVGRPEDYDFTIVNDKTLGLKQLEKQVHLIAHWVGLDNAKDHYIQA